MFNISKREKCPDPFADKVKCEVCKCWLNKGDAHIVNRFPTHILPPESFFCQVHKKPYSRVFVGRDLEPYLNERFPEISKYYGEVEMTETGEPIGYTKIVKKQ